MSTHPLAAPLLLIAGILPATAASALTVYQNDFEAGLDAAWSGGRTHAPALGIDSTYLGDYSTTQRATLTLTGLPSHDRLTLRFDLYLFNSWDGENPTWGKDYFSLSGDISFQETFTNHQSEGQSYPGAPDEVPYGTAGSPSATYVYRGLGPNGSGDAFRIDHSGDTFTVTFGGPTTQADEWWGIDNLVVSVETTPIPLPATLPLAGSLLACLLALRRRRGNGLPM